MDTLRRAYLFDLADICGLSAEQVDDLRFLDFLTYLQGIDNRREMRKDAQKAEFPFWVP